MASFGSAGRFGGKVKSKVIAARRILSEADEKKVRSKLKAAAYTQGGVDWHKLFCHYDRDNSGEIGTVEFRRLLRSDAKIPVSQLSDNDVKSLFNSVDVDGSGEVDADEFLAWVQGGPDGRDNNLNESGKRRRRTTSTGYGHVSPTALSSPSQRRFDTQKGWLRNNHENSEADGAVLERDEDKVDNKFDRDAVDNERYNKAMLQHVRMVSPGALKRAATVSQRSSSKQHQHHVPHLSSHAAADAADDRRVRASAQRAIDEATSSLANSARVNSGEFLLHRPPLGSSSPTIDTEANIDALLQLQREKDRLQMEMRRMASDTENKDAALEEAAAAVMELQTNAQHSDQEASAWHRVVVEQKSELQRVLDDSTEKEMTIRLQAEQLRALKILVEARASATEDHASENHLLREKQSSSSPSLSRLSLSGSNSGTNSGANSGANSSFGRYGESSPVANSSPQGTLGDVEDDGSNDLVAQLRFRMDAIDAMDAPMRSSTAGLSPMNERGDRFSQTRSASSPLAASQLSVTSNTNTNIITDMNDHNSPSSMTFTEIELDDTLRELKKMKQAYNVASEQASQLSLEKIEVEQQLKNLELRAEHQMNEQQRKLDNSNHRLTDHKSLHHHEVSTLKSELRSTLSNNVATQREMLLKLQTSEGQRSILQQRVAALEQQALVDQNQFSQFRSDFESKLIKMERETGELRRREEKNTNKEQNAVNGDTLLLLEQLDEQKRQREKAESQAQLTKEQEQTKSQREVKLREEMKMLRQQQLVQYEKATNDINLLREELDRERHMREMSEMKVNTMTLEKARLQEETARLKKESISAAAAAAVAPPANIVQYSPTPAPAQHPALAQNMEHVEASLAPVPPQVRSLPPSASMLVVGGGAGRYRDNDDGGNGTNDTNNTNDNNDVSNTTALPARDTELEQLRVLVKKLTAQKLEIESDKDHHIKQLHSELQNLEVELEHVSALHDQKHEEVLRLSNDNDDQYAMVIRDEEDLDLH